jgi:uncharacterized protein YyaL (SSP411 family)
VLGDATYLGIARETASAVLSKMTGGLPHAFVDGVRQGQGFLDDHAFLIAALLDLYEVDPSLAWLRAAMALQNTQDARFADPRGGYAFTSGQHEPLLMRDRIEHDEAVPAANSVAAENLLRLYELTSDEDYRKKAIGTLTASGALLARAPGAMPRMLAALDFHLDKPKQIVLVAPAGGSVDALLASVRRTYVPNRVVVRVVEGDADVQKLIPLVEGKSARGGKPTAYVCVGTHCEQPTTDPDVLAQQLAKTEPY